MGGVQWRWILAGLGVMVVIGVLGAVTAPGKPDAVPATRAAAPTGLPDGGRCSGPELEVVDGPRLRAPAGPEDVSLGLRNRGSRTCTVGATPTLRFFGTAALMDFRVVRAPQAGNSERFDLPPGRAAAFSVLREACERVITKPADTVTVQPEPDGAVLGHPLPDKLVRYCGRGAARVPDRTLAGNLLLVTPLQPPGRPGIAEVAAFDPDAPGPCQADGLELRLRGDVEPTGFSLEVAHEGQTTCTLQGNPGATFFSGLEKRIPFRTARVEADADAVSLEPGSGTAVVRLTRTACADRSELTTDHVRLTLPDGGGVLDVTGLPPIAFCAGPGTDRDAPGNLLRVGVFERG